MTIPTHKCDIPTWLATHKNNEHVNMRLPDELLQAVQRLADDNGWEFSHATRYVMVLGLQKHGQPHQK